MPLSPIILRCILRDVWISRAGERNWAALDGALAKNDEIAKQIEGSVAASNKAQFERAAIRRILGSSTMQVLDLK